jgi:hypothetical protein
VSRLRALTTAVPTMALVTSNSESRFGEFGCDLLDTDTDVSHAAGRVASRAYLSNFTYQVAQYLDGSTEAVLTSRYDDADAAPEDVAITLPQLLDAMANFCGVGGCVVPSSYGADYNSQRLKAAGGTLSPQAMGLYLERRGLLSRPQLINLLKTNFMEANL